MREILQLTALIFLLFFLNSYSFAKESHLTCSRQPAKVYYVNGVSTFDPEENTDAWDSIIDLFGAGKDLDEKGVIFQRPYYNSYNGKAGDAIDAIYLRLKNLNDGRWTLEEMKEAANWIITGRHLLVRFMQEFFTINRADEMADKIAKVWKLPTPGEIENLKTEIVNDINSGSKVFVFAHSSGTMFMHEVASLVQEQFKSSPEKYEMLGGLFLASASPYLPQHRYGSNFKHITTTTDLVINVIAQGSLAPNVSLPWLQQMDSDWLGHGVNEIYLNSNLTVSVSGKSYAMTDFVKMQAKSAVSKMANSSIDCCNLARGKLWINGGGCSGDACRGGFVQEGISIEKDKNDLELDKNATICRTPSSPSGKPKITGKVSVKGKLEMGGTAQIRGSASSAGSPILIDAFSDKITIEGSSLVSSHENKSPKLKGLTKVTGKSTLIGASEIINSTIGSITGSTTFVSGAIQIENAIIEAGTTINSTPSEPNAYSIIERYPDPITLSGENKISRYFEIHKNLRNVTIEAASGSYNTQGTRAVTVGGGNVTVGENTKLKGFVALWEGIVGNGVLLDGQENISSTCTDCRGVTVALNAKVFGESTVIRGWIYLGGATVIDSQININLPTFDQRWSRLHHSHLENAVITGSIYTYYWELKDVVLSGQRWCTSVYSNCNSLLSNLPAPSKGIISSAL